MPSTTYARSDWQFRVSKVLGQMRPRATLCSQLWMMLFMLLVSVSPASAAFESRTQLKSAIDNLGCEKPLAYARVSIQYCGGWGYGPKSRKLREQLEEVFGSDISVTEIRDPGVTNNFEVVVNDDLIWSKKLWKVGFPENKAAVDTICEDIRERIDDAVAVPTTTIAAMEISIQYCGGWGFPSYPPKFHALKKELEEVFGSKITVKEIRDPGETGNFEVVVNGDLVWSKKTRGQGFPTTETDVETIRAAVRDRMHVRRVAITTIAALDVVQISIQYCGGWGYGPASHLLKKDLEDFFGGKISVTEIKDRGKTDNFEVVVNGDLVWSKKTRGQGFPKNKAAVEKIRNEITDRMRGRRAPTTTIAAVGGVVDISIQYCGGWGFPSYGPYSHTLKKQLEDSFGSEISVREIRDPGTTGNFEVVVNGDLVWSKRTRKQGFPKTDADVVAIRAAVRDRMHGRSAPITTVAVRDHRAATTTIAATEIHIQYCGGWGYASKSRKLREQLEEAFGSDIWVREIKDADITGNFEVFANGDLVWSKMILGQDFPTTDADVKRICDEIRRRRNGGS